MSEKLTSLFPLKIAHKDRKTSLDFIPDCEDKYGQGKRVLNIWHRLKVTQGPKAGQTFKEAAAPWQNKFITSLFGHCDKTGKFFHTEALLYISKKQGKALDINTPILTINGWSTMGELAIGDSVYGLNGKPTKIINTSEIMTDNDCYELILSDGRTIVADGGHLWMTSTASSRRRSRWHKDNPNKKGNRSPWSVITTKEISNTLGVNYNPGESNHQLPKNQTLENKFSELSIDPYILGLWLGDGTSSSAALTMHKDDFKCLQDLIIKCLGHNVVIRKTSVDTTHTIGLTTGRGHKYHHDKTTHIELSKLNLLNNKHIPLIYLLSSTTQRLKLLQGLMDTDGTVNKGKGLYPVCEFNTTSLRLKKDVVLLLRSLGYKTTITKKKAMLYDKYCGIMYRVRFTAFQEDCVFQLKRKNELLRIKIQGKVNRCDTVKIVSCIKVDPRPVRCIQVEASDGMFLAGEGLIPTHNSSMSGPLAIAAVLAFPVERGNVIILASTQKQAGIVYDAMCGTIEADPYLMTQFKIRRYKNDIIHTATYTKLSALPLEASALVGIIPSLAFIDELHVIGLLPKAKQLLEQIVSGGAVTSNPLTIYLTTAPLDKSVGVFRSMYQRAKRIHNGHIGTDKLFPILFELFDDELEKDNPSKWWQSNPSLGYTFSEEWLIESYNTALNDEDPSSIFNFYSQHLNIQAGEKFGISQWIPLDLWDKHSNKNLTLQRIIKGSEILYVSVDLGYRDDPSSIVVMGEKTIAYEADGTPIYEYSIFCQQYLHTDGYEKRKKQVEYDDFIASGELIVSEINDFDKVEITKTILELNKTKKLAAVGVDAYKMATFATNLINKKIEIIAVPQGWKLNPALIETERNLFNGLLINDGRPMLRWNVGNGQLVERGQAMALVKPNDIKFGKAKIDGLVCVVMCMNLATDPEIKPKTVDIMGMIG